MVLFFNSGSMRLESSQCFCCDLGKVLKYVSGVDNSFTLLQFRV